VNGVEIFYFSGTGNSLAVARYMAEELGAKLTSVTSMMDLESVDVEADVIGFVFPIYDFKAPPVVEDFIRTLEGIDSKYLFAVCTYGLAPSRSLRRFDKALRSRGGQLSAGFAVYMPHSGIGSGAITKTQQEEMLKSWKYRLEGICETIAAREKGEIESSSLLLNFSRNIRMVSHAMEFAKQLLLKGIDSLGFTFNEDCNACGICERICPVHNIEIVDGHPTWSDHCAGCFACLNWCPKEAISVGGLDLGIKPYHHPAVKLSDMMRHRERNESAER